MSVNNVAKARKALILLEMFNLGTWRAALPFSSVDALGSLSFPKWSMVFSVVSGRARKVILGDSMGPGSQLGALQDQYSTTYLTVYIFFKFLPQSDRVTVQSRQYMIDTLVF